MTWLQLALAGWFVYHVYQFVRRGIANATASAPAEAGTALSAPTSGTYNEDSADEDAEAAGATVLGGSLEARAEAVEGQLRLIRSRFVKHDDARVLRAVDDHLLPAIASWRDRFGSPGGPDGGEGGALAARWLGDIERRSDALRVLADAVVNRAVLDRMALVERLYRSLGDAVERGAVAVGATATRRPVVVVPDLRGASEIWSHMLRDATVVAVPQDLDTHVDAWSRVAWTAAWSAFQLVEGLPGAAVGTLAALAAQQDVEGAPPDPDVQRAVYASAAVLAWDWMAVLLLGPAAVHALRRQATGHERRVWWPEGAPPPVELRLYVATELLFDLGHAEEANALERSLAAHTRVDLVVVPSGGSQREVPFNAVVELVAALGAAWLRAPHAVMAGVSLLAAPGLSLSAAARSRARQAVQSLEGAGTEAAIAGVPGRELWAAMWEAALVRPHNVGLFVRAARRAGERAGEATASSRAGGAAAESSRRGFSRADLREAMPLLDVATARSRAVHTTAGPHGRFAVDARRPLR